MGEEQRESVLIVLNEVQDIIQNMGKLLSAFSPVWSLFYVLGEVCSLLGRKGETIQENCHLNHEAREHRSISTVVPLPPALPPPTMLNALTDPDSLLLFVLDAPCTCLIACFFIPACRPTPWTRVLFRVWTRTLSCCHKMDVALTKG